MFSPVLDALLVFSLTAPLVAVLASRLGQEKLVVFHTLSGFAFAFGLLIPLQRQVADEGVVVLQPAVSLPIGSCLAIDSLSIFFVGIYLVIGFTATIHSIKYMEEDANLTGYYTMLLGIVAGMVGVTMAGDLFTLFIFWEIMCICSYALVAFRRERWAAVEAGFKYLIMSGAGSTTSLFGMSLLYGMTGSLNLSHVSTSLASSEGGVWMYTAMMMLVAGFGLQAGMAPLHTWLPDAHSAAPSPVSALLSGAMVKTGVYGMIRVLIMLFNPMKEVWQTAIALLALLTMFTGNIMALMQDDLKRLLAFSTISNMGYVLAGIAVGSLTGLTGSLLHILNHAVVKGLLFLCAGSFIHGAQTGDLKELRGVVGRMPVTSTIFLVGVIATAGLPSLNVFWSESTIFTAGINAGMIVFSGLLLVNLGLSAIYCLRLIQTIASRDATELSANAVETPALMIAPILALFAISVMIGLYPDPFRSIAEEAAKAAFDIETYTSIQLNG